MATAAARAPKRDLAPDWRDALRASMQRLRRAHLGRAAGRLSASPAAVALATHSPTDPSLSTAAGGPPANWLGSVGAYASDALLLLFGLGCGAVPAGDRARRPPDDAAASRPAGSAAALLVAAIGAVLIGIALGLTSGSAVSGLPGGWGGALGLAGAYGVDCGGRPDRQSRGRRARCGCALLAVRARRPCRSAISRSACGRRRSGWLAGLFRRDRASAGAAPRRTETERDDDGSCRRAAAVAPGGRGRRAGQADRAAPGAAPEPQGRAPASRAWRSATITSCRRSTCSPRRPRKAAGSRSTAPGWSATPACSKACSRISTSAATSSRSGPGPVVTMYELEPASGIKASRVIQLADDIARNMSALSARVATIPGRSVIGIELPNPKREAVALSELIGSQAFEDQNMSLPLILGKNIAGDPVIADLAPMPHLLVAGTTGSGKSVGLNCMILSLLYRMSPDECRLIMIDPKMLELSIYDDIPHLLAPVVTEPGKAIRALKWTVEQMEERYRMMANLGVRALPSFNAKVRDAKAKGAKLGRRVQTGYDADTGQPLYETEELEYEVLPQIVVVVDELADLMMTAGKEVEFLIQRLAQKARAAGIHLIMATQRPSVDVITGVIKANLPTRISFQVTSKIDSRTILGEQGAEQLLGKGDMLYMPGGKQIIRVHGPFVSDEEVRAVAEHWRKQGVPEYVQAVTEEPEDGGYLFDGQPTGEDDAETQLYRKAIQIVAESQKASTSYLQRQLRVGYNSAARLIERMEKDGLVGQPDHVGRREVLIDPDGHPI